MEALFREIESLARTEREADMRQYTTFKIGGKAALMAFPESTESVLRILALCKNVPHAVIGNGSNLLVGDGGFRGVIIRIGSEMGKIRTEGNRIFAGAGASLAAVSRAAMEAGLSGMAPLAGIPGTVGGAVMMNAGAYGGEMRDVVEEVTCILPDGNVEKSREHGFSYRHSRYMDMGAIVTEVVFSLSTGDKEEIRAEMEALAQKRRDKQPLNLPSAGSAFKRPKDGFAAEMIDKAGLRGFSVGGAAVSEKHAGFVVNQGGATAKDVKTLLEKVQEKVFEKYGVKLEPEIRFLGDFT